MKTRLESIVFDLQEAFENLFFEVKRKFEEQEELEKRVTELEEKK